MTQRLTKEGRKGEEGFCEFPGKKAFKSHLVNRVADLLYSTARLLMGLLLQEPPYDAPQPSPVPQEEKCAKHGMGVLVPGAPSCARVLCVFQVLPMNHGLAQGCTLQVSAGSWA